MTVKGFANSILLVLVQVVTIYTSLLRPMQKVTISTKDSTICKAIHLMWVNEFF